MNKYLLIQHSVAIVEHEIAVPDNATGCGYPAWVFDAPVESSNHILQRLQTISQPYQKLREALRNLPFTLVTAVSGERIAIVHGDAESLAGWGFPREKLATLTGVEDTRRWFEKAAVEVFASTHTCAPVCRSFAV